MKKNIIFICFLCVYIIFCYAYNFNNYFCSFMDGAEPIVTPLNTVCSLVLCSLFIASIFILKEKYIKFVMMYFSIITIGTLFIVFFYLLPDNSISSILYIPILLYALVFYVPFDGLNYIPNFSYLWLLMFFLILLVITKVKIHRNNKRNW